MHVGKREKGCIEKGLLASLPHNHQFLSSLLCRCCWCMLCCVCMCVCLCVMLMQLSLGGNSCVLLLLLFFLSPAIFSSSRSTIHFHFTTELTTSVQGRNGGVGTAVVTDCRKKKRIVGLVCLGWEKNQSWKCIVRLRAMPGIKREKSEG